MWLFLVWVKKAGLKESSPLRFGLIFLPATYFLLIAFSGWAEVMFLRVDILGLIFFNLITLACWLVQGVTLFMPGKNYKMIYIISAGLNQVLYLGLVIFVYSLKSHPLTAVSISTFFESFQDVNFLKILWEGLDVTNPQQNVSDVINKVLIALGSYVPLTALRLWYTNKKFKQLRLEIDYLKNEFERIKVKDEASDI